MQMQMIIIYDSGFLYATDNLIKNWLTFNRIMIILDYNLDLLLLIDGANHFAVHKLEVKPFSIFIVLGCD
uniref:Uncharacterized protein n=1 Tax=Tetranychus urticae TaxID=32264 RepID=T1KF96_TETUR